MHLSDGQIQRLMHGEMDAGAREEAARHAAECPACAQALEQARREEETIFNLLEHLDHEAPVVDAATVVGSVPARSGVWVRRAAGIVIVAALAGAAYAVPGSPLPALVTRLVTMMTGQQAVPPAGIDVPTPDAPATSGIAVPAGENLVIQFVNPQQSGSMMVSLTDVAMVRVRVLAGTAAFTTDAGRLDVTNPGTRANYEIEIPRAAPRIEIRVGLTTVFQKDGDHVVTDFPVDANGAYSIPVTLAP